MMAVYDQTKVPEKPELDKEDPTEAELKAHKETPIYKAWKKAHDEATAQDKLLLWYVDSWLPQLSGHDVYGDLVRPYKRPIDTMEVEGKQKVIITTTSEAYGLLLFENSRERWLNVFKWKKANPKKNSRVPTYNKKRPETHEFKNLWSDAKIGPNREWEPYAYDRLAEHVTRIKAFRDAELGLDDNIFDYALTLVKELHEVEEGQTQPRKKKRRISDVCESDEEDSNDGRVELAYLSE